MAEGIRKKDGQPTEALQDAPVKAEEPPPRPMSRRTPGVRKKGGRYAANVTIDGRRIHETFDTAAEGKAWRAEQIAQAAKGAWIDPRSGKVTLASYAERWIAGNSARWSDNTIRNYRLWLGHVPEPRARMSSVTTGMVREWQATVAQNIGVPTANKMVTTLYGMFQQALEDRMVGYNPAGPVKQISHKPNEREFLEPHELDRVLAHLDGEWHDLVMFLAFTGMRGGDARKLTGADVDRFNMQVRVTNEKSKNKAAHWVPLIGPIQQMVLDRADREGFLFTVTPGYPMDASNLNKHLKRAVAAAGVNKNISTHSLRHTFATVALQNGASLTAVSRWLGHSSVQITLSTYSHCLSSDFIDVAAVMQQAWDGRDGGLRSVQ